MAKTYTQLASCGSTVVEYSPHHPTVEVGVDANVTTGTGKESIKKVTIGIKIIVCLNFEKLLTIMTSIIFARKKESLPNIQVTEW
jgi:hypothetical protein